MRAVIQRVSRAAVVIDDAETAAIGPGLLVLAGVEEGDTEADIDWPTPAPGEICPRCVSWWECVA